MIKRVKLGKLEEAISQVGFGGIVVAKEAQRDANNYVSEAMDAGINYFDVAPTYMNAEDRLGPALKGKRNKVFLACKTEDRTRAGSRKLLEASLKKLQTDYFDLYQLHAVYSLEDVEKIFASNGAFETYIQAKKQGHIKNIGFSAHSTEAALALMDRYDFDTIMFPFNFVSLIKKDYGARVLEKALEKNMGIIGIKSMALTEFQEDDKAKYPKAWYHPIEDYELAAKAVNYSLSRGVDAVIPPGNIHHFRWALNILKNGNTKLSPDDLEVLQKIAHETKPLFPLESR